MSIKRVIHLVDKLWIGSADAVVDGRNLAPLSITGILNVALDLKGVIGWPNVEYMQVGLVDGPGNPPLAYISAIFALHVLCTRHLRVLVCCHGGSRSMAVAIMYLNIACGPCSDGINWDQWMSLLNERSEIDLPVPHEAHRSALSRMDWSSLKAAVESLV